MKKYLLTLPVIILLPKIASAHCPLCTAGVGALAVLAASLGVSSIVVGILVGAFALALSIWIARTIKKQYVPFQRHIVTALIYVGTVVPIMPFIQHYGPFYVPFIGEYGTTYTVNLYIFGAVIGTLIMLFSPVVSKFVTQVRGKKIPYQGVSVTLGLLIMVSVVIQLLS